MLFSTPTFPIPMSLWSVAIFNVFLIFVVIPTVFIATIVGDGTNGLVVFAFKRVLHMDTVTQSENL